MTPLKNHILRNLNKDKFIAEPLVRTPNTQYEIVRTLNEFQLYLYLLVEDMTI